LQRRRRYWRNKRKRLRKKMRMKMRMRMRMRICKSYKGSLGEKCVFVILNEIRVWVLLSFMLTACDL
jgi:hypothetical protein